MDHSQKNIEQLILEAAEDEFLEKGYLRAKTTEIARRVGVTHAMLHYYYRTKGKLFHRIFEEKVNAIADSLLAGITELMDFEAIIELFMRTHYLFLKENPRLFRFVYTEVTQTSESREVLLRIIGPKVSMAYGIIDRLLQQEIAAGRVRSVRTIDLMLNMATINLAQFMVHPALFADYSGTVSLQDPNDERMGENIAFVKAALNLPIANTTCS